MITCPHGKQHSIAELKCVVKRDEADLDKAITIDCGCGGRFWTLKRAMRLKLITEEFANEIRHRARVLRAHKSSLACD